MRCILLPGSSGRNSATVRFPITSLLAVATLALLLATPSGAAPESGWETILLPVTVRDEGEGRVRMVSLAMGSEWGLARGQRGKFSSRRDQVRGLDFVEQGWIEIVSVTAGSAQARVTLDNPELEI